MASTRHHGTVSMKILLADDEPIARTMLEHWLTGWGHAVITAKDGQAALEALEQDSEIRCAVLDWVMPRLDGVEVCRAIRVRRPEPQLHVILLTARDDKQDIARGLDAGADDYLIKPCSPFDLRMRLRAGERMLELEDQLKVARAELAAKALRDSASGALSRNAALEFLAHELVRGERRSEWVSIILARFDSADELFQSAGEAAEHVVEEAVRRFSRAVRGYDQVGRFGPSELLLTLPHCAVEQGVLVAQRLQTALSGTPLTVAGSTFRVTASYGVASTSQRHGSRVEQLLRAADKALMRASSEGRNNVRFTGAQEWLDSVKAGAASSVPAA